MNALLVRQNSILSEQLIGAKIYRCQKYDDHPSNQMILGVQTLANGI